MLCFAYKTLAVFLVDSWVHVSVIFAGIRSGTLFAPKLPSTGLVESCRPRQCILSWVPKLNVRRSRPPRLSWLLKSLAWNRRRCFIVILYHGDLRFVFFLFEFPIKQGCLWVSFRMHPCVLRSDIINCPFVSDVNYAVFVFGFVTEYANCEWVAVEKKQLLLLTLFRLSVSLMLCYRSKI